MQRLVFIALLVMGKPAIADDAAPVPASLSFQYSGLKFTHMRTESTGENAEKRKGTSLLSGDMVDSFLYATINGKLNLYFYPFQDANTLFSVGYMLQDTLEVGIDIGLNNSKLDAPKEEVSSDLLGGFVTWTLPLSGMSLENFFVVDFSRRETTFFDVESDEELNSRASSTYLKASSTLVIPIAKNASYLGGLWIAADRSQNHTMDSTRKSTQLGVMLAGLRISVE